MTRRRTSGEDWSDGDRPADDRAVYIISVAAELAGMHPQTLRSYERLGLLRPQRSRGNTRRYSERDIARLRAIQHLTQDEGINLAGARMVMEMQAQIEQMREEMDRMRKELVRSRRRARDEVSLVPLRNIQFMPWQEGLMR
jgi:MerR family transcriptional regulator/heat shock protein HspR